MSRWVQLLLISLAAVLLGGCAGVAQQSYAPSKAPLKRVLIATPAAFPTVTEGVAGNAGLMFGPVGAVAATYDVKELSAKLEQAITSQGVHYEVDLLDKIRANFAAAGIATEVVAVKEREPRSQLVQDYKALAARGNGADAILDIAVLEAAYGAVHPMLDPEFRPILRLRARLVSARTLETLYANDIFFGYSNPFMSAQEIKAPKKYYFRNLDAVLDDKPKAAEGMHVAATEVAQFLTDQFIHPQQEVAAK